MYKFYYRLCKSKFDKDMFNLIKAERVFGFSRFKFIIVSLVRCMCMDIECHFYETSASLHLPEVQEMFGSMVVGLKEIICMILIMQALLQDFIHR